MDDGRPCAQTHTTNTGDVRPLQLQPRGREALICTGERDQVTGMHTFNFYETEGSEKQKNNPTL